MSRKNLSRKFDFIWPDGESAPIPCVEDPCVEEKYIRSFSKKDLSILVVALIIYITQLRQSKAHPFEIEDAKFLLGKMGACHFDADALLQDNNWLRKLVEEASGKNM